MQSIYSTSILFFNLIPEHNKASVPSWQKFKIPLQKTSGPSTYNHSHSLIIVESVTFQLQQPKQQPGWTS